MLIARLKPSRYVPIPVRLKPDTAATGPAAAGHYAHA